MLIAGAMMVLGVMLSGCPRDRWWGAAGLVPLGLGVAAARVIQGTIVPASEGFLAVNAGLELLGLVLVGVGLGRGALGPRTLLTQVGVASGTAGVLAAVAARGPMMVEAGLLAAAGVAAFAGAVLVALLELGRRSGIGVALRRGASAGVGLSPSRAPLVLFAAGAASVTLGPHIGLVLAGAALSAWAAWAATPSTARPLPVAPILVLLLAGAAWWLLAAIAGPEGLALAAIPALPLSAAAELLIAPLVLGAAWALGGLWPLRQPLGGALTAPLGALLLIRVGVPAIPAGLEHWRPAAFPVVLLGLWYAALTRRLSTLAIGGAYLGLASVEPTGVTGAGWLLACAVAVELLVRVRPHLDAHLAHAFEALTAVAAAWGAMCVIEAGLRTETVYTVLGALAVVAAVRPHRVDPS